MKVTKLSGADLFQHHKVNLCKNAVLSIIHIETEENPLHYFSLPLSVHVRPCCIYSTNATQ